MNEGAALVVKTLDLIKHGKVHTQKQDDTRSPKEAPKLNRENTKINWNAPVEKIYNLIRGLNPYPAAWCELYNGPEVLPVQIL
jgi:methionyl-tRNA formyltransferase